MGKAVSINRSKIHEPLVQRISGEKAFVAKESGKKLFPTIREFLTFCALLGFRKGVKEPLDRSYGTEDIQGVIYEDTEALAKASARFIPDLLKILYLGFS